MRLEELLGTLSDRGVKIWAEDGQLRLRAPKGVLSEELKTTLAGHKAELLELLGHREVGASGASVPLEPLPRDGDLPLSFMQERLRFLWRMYPESAVYNLPNARRMRGPLDVDALKVSIEAIVSRHEVLRSVFHESDEGATQIPTDSTDIDFELVDVSGREDPEAEATRFAQSEIERPFSLTTGPLLRVKVLRLGADDHLLLWYLHHIVSDGWSSMLFLRELKALYEEKVTGAPAVLPELPVQFADFASWEREWLQGDRLEAQLSYWRTKLGGRLPILELPADHPRPAMRSYRGRSHPLALPTSTVLGLKALGKRTGTTLYMVLVAALKTLLHRYTRQDDICLGSPIARRTRPEIENVMGCFINTLVLRTDLSGDPSVVELLGRIRQTCTEAFDRQDVPFEALVEELKPERDPSHTPLFQVMLILHVQDTRKVSSLGDVSIEATEFHATTSKLDLTLELKETAGGLEGWLEYNTDLFEATTIARLVEHFRTLVDGIVANPDQAISRLPLLPVEERNRLLVEWNRTETDYPNSSCVHELISLCAERTPEAVAVQSEGASLSYGELDEQSNRLARFLQARGVGRETPVGLCVERSTRMVVGLLGILKAGGAYVPLDPAFPAERLSFMAKDAGLSVLVSESSLKSVRPTPDAQVVELDTDWDRIAAESGERFESPAGPESLAYVIYTSGSTGLPKGVQIEHRALVNFLSSMQREPGLSSSDKLVAVTTLSFDIAGLELYLPLISGACVIVASREQAADGRRLLELLHSSGATIMQATPATWRMLLESGWSRSPELKVLCGGEALAKDLAEELVARAGEVWNVYGPTETTIWSTAHKLAADEGPVLVGRPIANTKLYVLDGHEQPVPTGVAGELYIGGSGLARGYLARDTLTAQRFVSDPFAPGTSDRLYRTGDLARYHEDGTVEVLGRLDHQVKVRGFRIELGEIETVLVEHEGIGQAVVSARDDGSGDKRLVAYYIAKDDNPPNVSEMRSHLREKLPDYMVPAVFVRLEEFPLTPNGKVDRGALPAPDDARPELEDSYVAPRSPAEETVASVWSDVLGVDQVGAHDDFFALGGHSLLGLRFVSQIERQTGVSIPLVELFQLRTVERLAGLLEGDSADTVGAVSAIRSSGSMSPFFAVGSHPGYVDAATRLDPTQPFYRLDVYALQNERTAEGHKPHATIEDIAADFVHRIRAVQPNGPYFIGGGCEGALVAFEMAKQMQSAGDELACLALWITPAPTPVSSTTFSAPPWSRLAHQARGLWSRGGFRGIRWRELVGLAKHEYLEHKIFRAMDTYAPRGVYRGNALIVRTKERGDWEPVDDAMGWDALVDGHLELRKISGDHGSWLRDHADEFGDLLEAYLAGTRRSTSLVT